MHVTSFETKVNICDLICVKGLLLKHLNKCFVYIQLPYMHNYSLVTVCMQNCFLDVITVLPLLQSYHKCFNRAVLIANQVAFRNLDFCL